MDCSSLFYWLGDSHHLNLEVSIMEIQVRNIGDAIVSYSNPTRSMTFNTICGNSETVNYSFFVPEKAAKKQHQTAINWAGGNAQSITIQNSFTRMMFQTEISQRMSRKVIGVMITDQENNNYRIEIDLEEMLLIMKYFTITEGQINEEFVLGKCGSRWCPINDAMQTEINEKISNDIEKTIVVKRKDLTVGSQYVMATRTLTYLGDDSQGVPYFIAEHEKRDNMLVYVGNKHDTEMKIHVKLNGVSIGTKTGKEIKDFFTANPNLAHIDHNTIFIKNAIGMHNGWQGRFASPKSINFKCTEVIDNIYTPQQAKDIMNYISLGGGYKKIIGGHGYYFGRSSTQEFEIETSDTVIQDTIKQCFK